MIRSAGGMYCASRPSVVVLPVPAAPAKIMFARARIATIRNCAIRLESVRQATRSASLFTWRVNLRIVTTAPLSASGGMTTFPREPSGRRKSMYGTDAEISRPQS